MNLDETQKRKVAVWVTEGLKLADIQKRISAEFGLSLTYMEARFLVDDLKLVPHDVERPKVEPASPLMAPAAPAGSTAGPATGAAPAARPAKPVPAPAAAALAGAPAQAGGVAVSVDTVTRPGALVSGTVRFSDGQVAAWYMDQHGRLGLAPQQPGYKPSAVDVEAFQRGLETELGRLGM